MCGRSRYLKKIGVLLGEQKRGKNGCSDTSLGPVLTSCMKLDKPASHFELCFLYQNNGGSSHIHVLFP